MTRNDSALRTVCLGSKNCQGRIKNLGRLFTTYGNNFYNYITILRSRFGKEAPDRHAALVKFHNSVYELSTAKEWQEAVLPWR